MTIKNCVFFYSNTKLAVFSAHAIKYIIINIMLQLIVPMTKVGFCLKRTIKNIVKAKIMVASRGIRRTACQSVSFSRKNIKISLTYKYLFICFTFDSDN